MKKNNITLSELRNIIKEEIQSQLTKKNLVESVNKKSKKAILKEATEMITFNKASHRVSGNSFIVSGTNAEDKITTIPLTTTGQNIKIEFKYFLETQEGSAESNDFQAKLLNTASQINYFTLSDTQLNIVNHVDTLKKTSAPNQNLKFRLELVIYHPTNISIITDDFKGQKEA
jgi:hypothetical protein